MTNKGTLLAFCEGRLSGSGDWAAIDILMRRSTDKGKTWEDVRTLVTHNPEKPPTSNATPIVDKSGVIHFLYQRNYERAYYINSADDGKTWSEPTDITYVLKNFVKYNWKVLAPGPGVPFNTGNRPFLSGYASTERRAPGGDHSLWYYTIYDDEEDGSRRYHYQ
jgi:sialidase-1